VKPLAQTQAGRALFACPPNEQQAPASEAVAEWASRINFVWGQGTTCTLELAKVVHAARCKLPRGEWARKWKSDRVGFSKRRGEMLVVIGRNLEDLSAQTVAHLPAGWSILYRLALLDRATLEREIEARAIHPGISLQEAKDLLAKFRGQADSGTRKPNVGRRLQNLTDFLDSTLADWSLEDLELGRFKFDQFAEVVRAEAQSRRPRTTQPDQPNHAAPFAFAG